MSGNYFREVAGILCIIPFRTRSWVTESAALFGKGEERTVKNYLSFDAAFLLFFFATA